MARRLFSSEEKQDIVSKIEASMRDGMNQGEACTAAGILPAQYRNWSAAKPKSKALTVARGAAVHQAFPIDNGISVRGRITIKGAPEDLGAFLRAVANGGG